MVSYCVLNMYCMVIDSVLFSAIHVSFSNECIILFFMCSMGNRKALRLQSSTAAPSYFCPNVTFGVWGYRVERCDAETGSIQNAVSSKYASFWVTDDVLP